MPAQGSTFSSLSHRLFLILWVTSLTGNVAHAAQSVAAQWLMTQIDGRADMVALIQTAISAPVMLLALVGGAVADVYDRRRVMLVAQASLAGISVLLALLSYQGTVTPWLLIALTFATGVGIAFYNPAAQSSIGRVVPREELAGAVSLNILGFNVARTLGPALGGAVVALGGIFAGYLGSALAFLAAAVLLYFWKPQFEREGPKSGSHIFAAMAAGFRCIRETRELTAVAARAFAFTLCGSAAWALMPLVARDLTGGGPEQFGMLLGALGLGAVIGAAFAHEVRRRFTGEVLVRTAGVIFGAGCLIISARPGFAVTFAVLVLGGAGWVQALSGFSVAGQLWAPRAVVGMVTATVSTMVFAGLALGSWAWGYLAEITSVAAAIAGSGIAMILIGALGLVLPLPRNADAPSHGTPRA